MTLGSLLTVKQAAHRLFGEGCSETDVNRLYRMIRRDEISVTKMGRRRFIPTWQIDKLERRHRVTEELMENAPVDS